MFTITLLIVVFLFGSIVFYKWATKNYNFFKDQNIKYEKPLFLFGNSAGLLWMSKSLPENLQMWYQKFPDEKIMGIFNFRTPVFFVRDPELMKQLCIKDFDHFTDHLQIIEERFDPVLGNALFSLHGKKWKDMRSTLSPAFTGSKIRQMFILIDKYTSNAMQSIRTKVQKSNGNSIEMKELFASVMTDIIASCAFGLETDSLNNPQNDFKKIVDKSLNFSMLGAMIKVILIQLFPKIMKRFDISILDKGTKKFFRDTITDTMSYREVHNIFRPDMINLLMEAKKGQLTDEKNIKLDCSLTCQWTNDEIVAQCLQFFLAGFDPTSNALSFAAYELAVNPDIQDRLRSEFLDFHCKLNGSDLTFENVQSIKYLDRFVMEVLRKWPPAIMIDRMCTKDYTFELDGNTIKISKEHGVSFVIYAFHHDPQYFPNPEKFDPDRFSDENIANQNMNAFFPFGMGPRSCIGNRFALINIKTVLYKMLLNFQFKVSDETQIPLKYKKSMASVASEKGIWLKLIPIAD